MAAKDLVLVGDGSLAQIAFEYFEHDSPYRVAGFAVEEKYREREELFGRPVIPYEDVTEEFPPEQYEMFVALAYNELNRLRERLYRAGKEAGYEMASYVSSEAFVWDNVSIGEHCFIFEHNTVQPWVEIGDNVVLWSGNHIGHHSTIENHCFVSSHVVLSGYTEVGPYCFLGVNSTIAHEVSIGKNCLVGADATILHDTGENEVYASEMTDTTDYSAKQYFDIA